jgi:hypothetical protein
MEPNADLTLENVVDFNAEKYKLDRETEREVYKAVGEYEHAGLRTLLALNGGAAMAFLTLLGAVWEKRDLDDFALICATGAISLWTIGLIVTGIALRFMYHAHHCLARQFRFRRLAEEVVRGVRTKRQFRRYLQDLTKDHLSKLHADLTTTPLNSREEIETSIVELRELYRKTNKEDTIDDKTSDHFIDQVMSCQEEYEKNSVRGRRWAYGAGALFIFGVAGALVAVLFLSTGPKPAATPSGGLSFHVRA